MLRLLDDVSHGGRPVTGERSQALLAALAAARGRPVAEADLVRAVWGEDAPGAPAKALQVVVSRTRSQTAPEAVVRTDGGYRLGVPATEVDVLCLAEAAREAARAEGGGDAATARDRARVALAHPEPAETDVEALADLRDRGRRDRARAGAVLGRALAALGDHDEALGLLREVADPDEATLAARLRAEAAVHGAPAALVHYERHREHLRDTLGVDPGPALQSLHAELLAADNPVRTGLQFEATSLVGRGDDVRHLRALVAESRVTSIVGPGGLGKTRLAHLLGREAEQPVVHFVELAGVASPDDVVGEVGSALGVRDSVSGRRVLTPEQRTDVRGRLAQQLDQAPTLLILDNCEHVVDAVADLVAPLVAATRQVRVVTTTRAPLAIAAERVFLLGALDDDAAVELFGQRAEAARPGVRLDDDVVRRVVARLDGLPLAIELAAAKVRAMSVADIDRRLDDRFALLRGHDRGAPDRHQTLLAVIDWSWNLLGADDRRALRRLSVFRDGFSLGGAEALVGDDALSALESLAGQSLLTVHDAADADPDDGLRYRMLETVREFGRDRLVEAGEERDARLALRSWARATCAAAVVDLWGPRQVGAVRRLTREENNLADVLREAIGEPDRPTVVEVLAALGGSWTIRGEHPRVISLISAVDQVLEGWEPTPDLVDATARATGLLVMNTAVIEMRQPTRSRELFARHAPAATESGMKALATVLLALDEGRDPVELVDDPDRHAAMLALQWVAHTRENTGDADGAIEAATRALGRWQPSDGPWLQALQHTTLAELHHQTGRTEVAARHARAALATLDALEADDDAVQMRAVLAMGALQEGDHPAARALLEEVRRAGRPGLFAGRAAMRSLAAELALAEDDVPLALARYREAVEEARGIRFPGLGVGAGFEPWVLMAEATSVVAHARHTRRGDRPDDGTAGHAVLAAKPVPMLAPGRRIDYPAAGSVFLALGLWTLLRDDDPGHVDRAVSRLAVADRFGYARYAPSLAWDRVRAEADAVAPGALDAAVAAYAGRRGPDVLDAARVVAAHADPS